MCEGTGSSLLTSPAVNSVSSWCSKLWVCIYFLKLNKWSYYGYIQYSFFQTNDFYCVNTQPGDSQNDTTTAASLRDVMESRLNFKYLNVDYSVLGCTFLASSSSVHCLNIHISRLHPWFSTILILHIHSENSHAVQYFKQFP